MTFDVPVTVSGSNSVFFTADSDHTGTGTLSFSSAADVAVSGSSVPLLIFTGADLILSGDVNAGPTNVTVQVSDSDRSKMSVGGVSSGGLYLDNIELNRISTTNPQKSLYASSRS